VRSGIRVPPENVEAEYLRRVAVEDPSVRRGAEVRARQVFTTDPEVARAALAELALGATFEEAARRFSEAPEASRGGDMGFVEEGVLPQEIDDALRALELGARSEQVVVSPYGYHLFQILDRREAETLPLDAVRNDIRRDLRARAEQKAYGAWIESLRQEFPITYGSAAP